MRSLLSPPPPGASGNAIWDRVQRGVALPLVGQARLGSKQAALLL
jgi:hypothetical protein